MNRANVFEHESKPGTVGELVDNLPATPGQKMPAPTRTGPPAVTPMQMLQIAVERGADMAMLEKLMDLQERWEKNEARKAFVAALNAFKADAPTITKNKEVSYGQGKTSYRHATLDQVCDVIGPALAKHGLSHRWEVEQGEHDVIRVSVILQHELGHSERVTLSAKPDASGSKNPIQAIGSATTYLSRYTLLLATGLATEEQDDDGKRGGGGGETISAEQKDELIALMKETGADVRKFLDYLAVETLDDLPAARFAGAKAALAKKKEKKA